jgi:hypothetical protein
MVRPDEVPIVDVARDGRDCDADALASIAGNSGAPAWRAS